MLWDCFLFRDELDLLALRLGVHSAFVGRTLLTESPRTFSNLHKPLVFQETASRFKGYAIEHVVADNLDWPVASGRQLGNPARMRINGLQWERLRDGLAEAGAKPDDVVLVSDMDELVRPSILPYVMELLQEHESVQVLQRLYNYYLNGYRGKGWKGPIFTTFRVLRDAPSMWEYFIEARRKGLPCRVPDGGWHFSYLGGAEAIAAKFKANAHSEHDNDRETNVEFLKGVIERGVLWKDTSAPVTYVPLDDTFPQYLIDNLPTYAHLVRPV